MRALALSVVLVPSLARAEPLPRFEAMTVAQGTAYTAGVVEALQTADAAARADLVGADRWQTVCVRYYVERLDRLVDAAVTSRDRLALLPPEPRAESELRLVAVASRAGNALAAEAERCVAFLGDGGATSLEVTGDDVWDAPEIQPAVAPDPFSWW